MWGALGLCVAWAHPVLVALFTLEAYPDGEARVVAQVRHAGASAVYQVHARNTFSSPLIGSARASSALDLASMTTPPSDRRPGWGVDPSETRGLPGPTRTIKTAGYGWPAVAFVTDFTEHYVGDSTMGSTFYRPRNGITTTDGFAIDLSSGAAPVVIPTRVVATGLLINWLCATLLFGVLRLSARELGPE